MSQIADAISSQFDRLPPHSIEAERCLVASLMLDKEMIGQVIPLVDRDAFQRLVAVGGKIFIIVTGS